MHALVSAWCPRWAAGNEAGRQAAAGSGAGRPTAAVQGGREARGWLLSPVTASPTLQSHPVRHLHFRRRDLHPGGCRKAWGRRREPHLTCPSGRKCPLCRHPCAVRRWARGPAALQRLHLLPRLVSAGAAGEGGAASGACWRLQACNRPSPRAALPAARAAGCMPSPLTPHLLVAAPSASSATRSPSAHHAKVVQPTGGYRLPPHAAAARSGGSVQPPPVLPSVPIRPRPSPMPQCVLHQHHQLRWRLQGGLAGQCVHRPLQRGRHDRAQLQLLLQRRLPGWHSEVPLALERRRPLLPC